MFGTTTILFICLFTGVTFGAACTLSLVEEVLRKLVAELPPYKTEIFQAVLEQLRWFAGPQIRNVAVSDSGAQETGIEISVWGPGLPVQCWCALCFSHENICKPRQRS